MNFISRVIVDSAYALEASGRYRRTRNFVDDLLNNDNFWLKRYFDLFMMALILSSVFILIRDVKFQQRDFFALFNDYIISIIFLVEYTMRLWVCSNTAQIITSQYEKDRLLHRPFRLRRAVAKALYAKWKYASSLSAIIDLLAIMPFFHEMRLFRLFIVFRVFKLFRYTQNMQQFAKILGTKKFELLTLFTFAGLILFVASVLIYVMEALNPESPVDTLFDALYWAIVTISTVGYGDVTPVTYEGRLVAMAVIVSGVAVLAFATSIVVSAFTENLEPIRRNKLVQEARSMKHFYLICGFSPATLVVASKLKRMGRHVVILEKNVERVEEARQHKQLVINSDPGALETYKLLGIDIEKQVSAVLLLHDSDIENVYTALTIRSMQKPVRILSLLHDKQHRRKLKFAGADDIVYAQEIIGQLSREYSGNPIAFEALHALRAGHTDIIMDEVLIDDQMVRKIRQVKDLEIRGRHIVLVGIQSVRENRFIFNPSPDFEVNENDKIVVIAEKTVLKEYHITLHR